MSVQKYGHCVAIYNKMNHDEISLTVFFWILLQKNQSRDVKVKSDNEVCMYMYV